MAKTDTRERTDEDVKDSGGNGNNEATPVVSDRRARRKAKRGEAFVKAGDAEAAPGEPQKKDRPTPSRRNAPKGTATAQKRNLFQRIPVVRPIYNYLASSVVEMRKVTWPNREETTRLTRMVLALTIFASIVLGTIDLFYGWWFRQALDNETLFLGLAAIVSIVAGAFTYIVFLKPDQYSY